MPVHQNSIKNLKPGKAKYGPGIKTESIRVPVELIPVIKALVAAYVQTRQPLRTGDLKSET